MKKALSLLLLLISTTVVFADDKIYSGVFVGGVQGQSFQPCGDEAYWLDATKWVLNPLQTFYKEEVKKADEHVYVTIRGHFHDEELNGKARDYKGIFHISEIYLFSSVVPDSCKISENNSTTENM